MLQLHAPEKPARQLPGCGITKQT